MTTLAETPRPVAAPTVEAGGRRFVVGCTIDVEQSPDSLHAHVRLDGDIPIHPGDRVRVHGDPIRVAFGESITLRRTAEVTRATWLERAWTRFTAHFELTELYEVSFSGDAPSHRPPARLIGRGL